MDGITTKKKHDVRRLVTVTLLLGFVFPVVSNAVTLHHFKNCKEMNKIYKGGVAKKGAKDKRKSGKAKYKPFVSTTLYNTNIQRDADHDGIACEQ